MISKKSLCALVLSLLPASLWAMGLGSVEVSSALNQPLDAKIQLISANTSELHDVKVKLAGADAFSKAGIDRPYHLTRLRFQTMVGNDGLAYIKVSTRRGVREPYLNFLLEMTWPKGAMVREYAILLDPPVVQQAAASVPKVVVKPKRAVTGAERPAASRAETYTVSRSETLWVIADKTRSDSAVSIEQQMMALQQINPDAFHRNNVNLLKAGATLQLPDRETTQQMSRNEARAAFRQQTREWKALRSQPTTKPRAKAAPVPVTPPPEPVVASREGEEISERLAKTLETQDKGSEEPVAEDPGTRLQVVETGREWQLAEKSRPSKTDFPATESDRLKAAIADSAEDLEAVKEINKDLDDLRSALEEKISTLRNSLEQKNRAIDELKQKLQSAGLDTGDKAGGKALDEVAEQKSVGGIDTSVPVGEQPEAGPADEPAKEETDFWNLMLLGGIGVFILLVVLLMARRNSTRKEDTSEVLEEFMEDEEPPGKEAKSEFIDGLFDDGDQVSGQADQEYEPEADQPEEERGDDVASVLTEADIYLAYRRYSQSEKLVQDAIHNHPDNLQLKLKMLEIFSFRKDRDRFSAYLEEIYPLLAGGPVDLLDRAMGMAQELVPEHPRLQPQEEMEFVPLDDHEESEFPSIDEDTNLYAKDEGDLDISIDELMLPDDKIPPLEAKEEEDQPKIDPGDLSIPDLEIDFGDDDDTKR
ncbi:MAG: FimV/HubP family polar landmark protein [Candidatus Sedimenticola sp. PURPLELP]